MPDDASGAVPVSSADVEGVEAEVTEEYSAAEVALLGLVAAAVAQDLAEGSPTASRRNTFRRKVSSYVKDLTERGSSAANRALERASDIGRRVARRSLGRRGTRNGGRPPGNLGPQPSSTPAIPTPLAPAPPATVNDPTPEGMTLDELRATAPKGPRTARGVTIRTPDALVPQLQRMSTQMVAAADGLYQQVLTQVLANPLDSEAARLRLAQRLLDQAATKGLTGFVDTAGRRWSMVSYVEMATRTAATRTAIDAHTALLAENGYDLVRVSVHANCSDLCAPFQGHLLSITGATTSVGPEPWRPRVVASLAEARARGFNHVNCRHFCVLWTPGDPLPDAPEVDPEHYKAEQHLRYLERGLRAARRREAVALDVLAERKARSQILAYRSRIASHVATNPTVLRKPHRERIDGPL